MFALLIGELQEKSPYLIIYIHWIVKNHKLIVFEIQWEFSSAVPFFSTKARVG